MDWSKAKTILIVALILTNIFLFAFISESKKEREESSSKVSFNEAQNLLKRKNIKLENEINLNINEVYRMDVEYQIFKPSEINNNFFEKKGIREYTDEAIVEIYRGSENVTIINEKYLIYTNDDELEDKNIDSIEKARSEALDFLSKRGFENKEDIELTYYRNTSTGFYLEFTKAYEDAYIENTFTTFRIDNSGVRRFERTWLDTKSIEKAGIVPIEPQKALLELLSMEEVYGKTIASVDLCYYFNPEKQDYLEEYLGAKEGRAVLAWRVQFTDGYKVILEFD